MLDLGPAIIETHDVLAEAQDVATETMQRVRRNVEKLERRLRDVGYIFAADTDEDWPHAVLVAPPREAPRQIEQIEDRLRGRFPLSVRTFITEVGWVDFNGHHPTWSPTYVDGLQVLTDLDGLDDLLLDMIEHDLLEDTSHGGKAHLELSADYLHKDNTSGGPAYGVAVPDAAADAEWLFDDLHPDHTFLGYLREVIADGGLPGWRRCGDQPPPFLHELVRDLESF